MTWPVVTTSPSPTNTSVMRDPSGSMRTITSTRAIRKPETRTAAEKHSLIAVTTVTTAPCGGRVVSAQYAAPLNAQQLSTTAIARSATSANAREDIVLTSKCFLVTNPCRPDFPGEQPSPQSQFLRPARNTVHQLASRAVNRIGPVLLRARDDRRASILVAI